MIIINGNLKCTPIAVRDKRKNKREKKTVRERERANAKQREVNGSAEGFFLLRWMYNKWKGKTQASSEARKDCEEKQMERIYSSLRKGGKPK